MFLKSYLNLVCLSVYVNDVHYTNIFVMDLFALFIIVLSVTLYNVSYLKFVTNCLLLKSKMQL